VLRFIENTDIESIEQFSIPENVISQINDVLNMHIDHHTDKQIRSRSFFKGVK